MGDDGEMWRQNLDEWLFDEKKVVTFKWLAHSLGVHVNMAKKMLFAFHGDNGDKLDVLYLMSGFLAANKDCIKVKLVRESELASSEADFSKVTSKHVYALASKTLAHGKLPFADVDVLKVDLGLKKSVMTALSGIKNKKAVPKTEPETEPEVKPSVVEKVEKEPLAEPKPENNVRKAAENPSSKSKDAKKGGAGNIARMFAKAKPKAEVKTEPVKLSPDNSPGKENKINDEKQKREESRKRREEGEQSGASKSKRRRRIQVMSDSEESSNDEDEADNAEEPIDEPAPPQAAVIKSDDDDDDEIIPSTPGAEISGRKTRGRRRVRKLVSKTFVDGSGFMVTKKQMESCSETDDEDEQPAKKSSPVKAEKVAEKVAEKKPDSAPTNKKKVSANGPNKQASIMNFFQRK